MCETCETCETSDTSEIVCVQRTWSVCSLCPHASLQCRPLDSPLEPLHSARDTRALPWHSCQCLKVPGTCRLKVPGTCRLKRDLTALEPTYMLTARDTQEEGAVSGGDGWQVATSVRSSPPHLACFTGLSLCSLWGSLFFSFVRQKVDARQRRWRGVRQARVNASSLRALVALLGCFPPLFLCAFLLCFCVSVSAAFLLCFFACLCMWAWARGKRAFCRRGRGTVAMMH